MNTSAPTTATSSIASPAPRSPAIDIARVSKSFRTRRETVQAVEDVSLRIHRGDIVALLGPNGAGKTSLLDMILGMTVPDDGTVRVFGLPARTAVSRSMVGAVQQVGGLLADLSVRETVTMIASLYPVHMAVDEALERAGAAGFARRKVSKCSGGQQQRVRFALALLPEPDLLVLDDVGAAASREGDQERKLFTRVISARYNHRKPTVITANLTRQQLEAAMGDRAFDRIQHACEWIVFDGPAYRAEVEQARVKSTLERIRKAAGL